MMVEVAIRERTILQGFYANLFGFHSKLHIDWKTGLYFEARGFYSKECAKMGFLPLLKSLDELGFSK